MQRMILRTFTAMSVMCLCTLILCNTAYANPTGYGPEMDPIFPEESENVSLTCPPPITVDCDENGIYMSFAEFEASGGSVNLPAGCVVDSFTFVTDVEISQNGCSFVYMREYFITETCGNTFTCNQIVLLVDDDNPVILDCPNDTTFQVATAPCTVSYMVPDVTTSDGCSDVTVTNDAPADFVIGSTLVTYTATDGCGNSSQCTFTVTVENTNTLNVTCPPDSTNTMVCDISGVSPYADFTAFVAAGGSVDGDCNDMSTTYTITNVEDTPEVGSCPKTVTRTYTISDEHGNEGSCSQMIIIDDDTDPTFTVPADMMGVECTMILDTSVTGAPTNVMDNCDANPVVSFMDSAVSPGSCSGEYSFTRTWTVTDECDNETQDVQTITVVDNTPPTALCVDTLILYLDDLGIANFTPADLDNGSSDDCGDVTLSADMSFAGCNQVGSPAIATLEVEDNCGNTNTCEVVIVALDTMSILLVPPTNDTVSCIADLDVPFPDIDDYVVLGGGSVNDNCPVGHVFGLLQADTLGTCPTIVERIYGYRDFSGNLDTAIHSIYVIDEEAPVILSCPPDISITETDLCDTLLVFGLPTAMDNCGEVTITNNYTNDGSNMAVFPGGITEVKFYATDPCGNVDSCTMVVTVDAEPKISCPPMGIIDSEDDLPDYSDLQAFLNAGGSVNMFCAIDDTTFMYSNTFVISDDGCSAEITETIMVNDTLGNPIVENKTSTAMDTLNPDISGCFTNFVQLVHATCEIDTTFFIPTATDNFGVDTTYYTVGAFVQDTATVTFYAEDLCGNIDSCEFDLIVFDPTSPDIYIDDITIMCDSTGSAPIYTTVNEFLTGPGAIIYDCRLDTASFVHLGDVMNMDGTITRMYRVDDLTGNIGTTTQTITIMDSTAPEFTMCTDNISVDAEVDTCGATIMVPLPTFMDNCGGMLTLTNDYTGTSSADGFYPVGETTVIWTIEDENMLTDTCSFTVIVTDVTVPDVSCPGDTVINCDIANYPPFASIQEFIDGGGTASDNCVLDSISFSTVETSMNIFERTYTVYDANGLENSCVQNIEVIDTIAPELTCVFMIIENTEINTCDKFITITPPIATDNCDSDVTITNSLTGSSDPSGTFSDTTSITWYAEDDFGNIDSCTYDIIVVDGTGPVVMNPDTAMIMCQDMLSSVDTFTTVQDIIDAGGSATDNCGIEFVNIVSETTNATADSVKRVYEIIDSTGNSSTLTHCIVIDDTTPPTFDAPADVTIECDADVLDLSLTGTVDSMVLMDNCMDIDTLIFEDSTDPAICPLVNEITRIWILTDNSGNETRDTQLISTIDTLAPVFDSLPATLLAIECDEAFPPMEILTATDNCSSSTVLMDTLPFLVNICAGYDVTYRWISVDDCQNRDTVLQSFTVNPDNTAPTLVSLNNMVLDAESDICGVRVENVAGPIFEENCSGFTLIRNYADTIYPVGITNVNWTARNDCGGETNVIQEIFVEDNTLPTVLCKNATAGLTADPQNYVFASSFVDTASDNCAIASIEVRRLTAACDDVDNNTFRDSIHICCDDLGTLVEVEIRVVDSAGNENFCDATLEVEDNRAPLVVEPLPNIVISCAYVFDTLDMEVFGSFTADPMGREDIIIEDTLYASQDSIAGIDGLISDECGVTIEDTTIVDLDICNNGVIRRVFTFTDESGNSSTSEQLIVIQDVTPFNENGTDIIWPVDFTWDQCLNPAPDTSISGSPSFLNVDNCAQVSASFKDQLFNFPTSSCPKIKRKWKVIDWCQYDENIDPNPGLWEYSQFIFVENNTPPTILSGCTDTLICAPNNECAALISLGIEAEDDCNADSQYLFYEYTINVNSDSDTSNDITGQGSSFELMIENGIHEVNWEVEDRCGNVTTCSYVLTVKECKAPTAVCLNGLAIGIDQNGEVELWASDVNQSSFDNCTASEDLIFSFSSDINDFGKVFDCDAVGSNVEIEMWVTDLEGNQSFCTTFVNVQDNNGYCLNLDGKTTNSSLEGKIITETNIAVPEAMVSIIGAEMDSEVMTEESGTYSFEDINEENDYQVSVQRDKNDLEGVSTLDLVMIQRHILGLDKFDSPYKLIASDINNNEKITASDLVALRKLILGIDDSFQDNESWRFVSMNEQMHDMDNPWPFSEDLVIGNTPVTELEADFVGVKIGDVNNSSDALLDEAYSQSRNAMTYGLTTADQIIQRDEEVFIELINMEETELQALQMTIEWDPEAMNFLDIIPIGIYLEDAFVNKTRVEEGLITIAWSDVDRKTIAAGVPMMQLIYEGNFGSKLSDHFEITSSITSALAYDGDDQEYNIELRFTEGQRTGLTLLQNKPNPFAQETVVEFSLPEDMYVTFKVFNGAGSLIYELEQYYTEGVNSFKLNDQLKDHKGILFLKMDTAEFSEVKRMIRIE
ncbi:MAG: HYR domain-containing protein [Saprospiraceae bacterium]|nr:HYR domain-containing protein [Saprospiraceae bacterium]